MTFTKNKIQMVSEADEKISRVEIPYRHLKVFRAYSGREEISQI